MKIFNVVYNSDGTYSIYDGDTSVGTVNMDLAMQLVGFRSTSLRFIYNSKPADFKQDGKD